MDYKDRYDKLLDAIKELHSDGEILNAMKAEIRKIKRRKKS